MKYQKLNAVKFGLACGIVSGVFIALTTLFSLYGYATLWGNLIEDIYGFMGYSISWIGVLIGAIYGFIDGFVMTSIFAWIYNKLI